MEAQSCCQVLVLRTGLKRGTLIPAVRPIGSFDAHNNSLKTDSRQSSPTKGRLRLAPVEAQACSQALVLRTGLERKTLIPAVIPIGLFDVYN